MSLGNAHNHEREKMAKQKNKEAEDIRINTALDFLGCLSTSPQARHDLDRIKLYILYLNLWSLTFSLYLVHSRIFPSIHLQLSCESICLVFLHTISILLYREDLKNFMTIMRS